MTLKADSHCKIKVTQGTTLRQEVLYKPKIPILTLCKRWAPLIYTALPVLM